MIVKQKNNQIEISFKFDPKLIAFVKGLEGRRYSASSKSWTIPLAGASVSIEQLERKGFAIEPALLEAIKHDQEAAQESVALAVMPDTDFSSPLPLFPYQKVGASFLYKIGSGLMGDEVGLGKTLMSLAVAEKTKARKVLVFCPASVKWQWAQEIEKFCYLAGAPKHEIVVIEGSKNARDAILRQNNARFFIANYELLLRNFDSMNCREWDIIIADEATKISNATAKQSKAIKRLRAKRRIAMTGTPVSNRANEIWNIMDFCVPGVFGNYYAFLQRYCLKNQFGGVFGYQRMDELRDKLKRYMIRRQKIDVLPELPEKIITDFVVEMSEEEKILYKRIKKEILFEIAKEDISKIDNPMTIQYTLVKLLRLRMIADSCELIGENKKSSKIEALKEILHEIFGENATR